MRRACIDIGSNTTRLLVADCDALGLSELYQERAFTRIGRALGREGRLAEDKLEEVSQVVARQLASARAHGAVEVHCVATASVRNAANSSELVDRIRERCGGLTVEVLSGEQEARFAFAGAALTLDPPPEGLLGVIDVGGGSTELAVGMVPAGVQWWASLPLGSGSLTDSCVHSDPPSADELGQVRARVTAALSDLKAPAPALAVAVGGSATSVGRLVGPVLDRDTIGRALRTLAGGPAADLARRFGIDPERVALIPAALIVLDAVSVLLGRPLAIGRGGLREGILLEGGL